jgi:DNA-binding GntR family transcriptional regulator
VRDKRQTTHSALSQSELYSALVGKIMSGEYSAGQRLVEADIARTFKTSRTPVREVLLALAKDGLIERTRNCGARVKVFTPDDIEEIYDIRRSLECLSVRLATSKLPLNQLLDLERRLDALNNTTPGPGWNQKQHVIDQELHRLIQAHCGNRRLIDQLENISLLINSLRSMSRRKVDHMRGAGQEHIAIIRALLQRDSESAERRMWEHIETSKRNALSFFFRGTAPIVYNLEARSVNAQGKGYSREYSRARRH